MSLTVYDLMGQKVATLVEDQAYAAGRYNVKFDATGLASGTYFYKLRAGDFTQVKKMTLLK